MHLTSLSTWHQQLGISRVPYPSLFLILPFGRNDKVDEIASYKVKVIIGPFPDCGLDTGMYTMSPHQKGFTHTPRSYAPFGEEPFTEFSVGRDGRPLGDVGFSAQPWGSLEWKGRDGYPNTLPGEPLSGSQGYLCSTWYACLWLTGRFQTNWDTHILFSGRDLVLGFIEVQSCATWDGTGRREGALSVCSCDFRWLNPSLIVKAKLEVTRPDPTDRLRASHLCGFCGLLVW